MSREDTQRRRAAKPLPSGADPIPSPPPTRRAVTAGRDQRARPIHPDAVTPAVVVRGAGKKGRRA